MRFLAVILMFICFSCTTSKIQDEQPIIQAQIPQVGEIEMAPQTNYTEIGNSTGIIVLKDNYNKKDTVKIYNDDGSLWYKFTYYYDDSDGKFDYPNDEFRPYAFHPDNFVLALEVIKVEISEYKIIVNKKTRLVKKVKKESFLQFLTWDQYVLNAFSIGFNHEVNPIQKEPQKESGTIAYKQENIYHPIKIQGEWLQIKWGSEGNWNYGWIKWKEENRLLIEIYLFA